jgi:hypothetical protein
MRPKHLSLLTIVLSILVIGGAAWVELVALRQDRPPARRDAVMPLFEVKVPPTPVLEQMDYLERRMHLLSAPPPQIKLRADLSGLGYVPLTSSDRKLPTGTSAQKPGPDYRLTLAFHGRVKRYCVIDDHLYPEGALLPGGATIVKIESRRVLIAKESLRQWLDIAPIFDAKMPEES